MFSLVLIFTNHLFPIQKVNSDEFALRKLEDFTKGKNILRYFKIKNGNKPIGRIGRIYCIRNYNFIKTNSSLAALQMAEIWTFKESKSAAIVKSAKANLLISCQNISK